MASVSGEAETRRKTQKKGQNQWDLALSGQDPVRISSNLMIFPPNCVENRRIWCIYAGSDCFGRRNLPNQAKTRWNRWRIRQNLMSSGRSSFTGFGRGDSKPTRQHWVLELGTHGRLLEQSDRVNASRVRASWVGGQVDWTALSTDMKGISIGLVFHWLIFLRTKHQRIWNFFFFETNWWLVWTLYAFSIILKNT